MRNLARLPDGGGLITFAADFPRQRLFGLTWPKAWLAVATPGADGEGGEWGVQYFDYPGRGDGEATHPSKGSYRPVCRAMAVDPRSGRVYWTNSKRAM